MGLGPSKPPPRTRERRLEDVCTIDRHRKPLGKGSFGVVWLAHLKAGGGAVAVKSMDKHRMAEKHVLPSTVLTEVALMRESNEKECFVYLHDFIDDTSAYFLVLEYCDGGSLDSVAGQSEGKFGEVQVVRLMSQILEGIAFLHLRSICHRDIKPQNIMTLGKPSSEHVKVKLGDFGIAVRARRGELLTSKVGTPAFMAPEMHLLPKSAGYDHLVDMWAAGGVMVFLLAHEYPFVDTTGRILQHELLRGDLPLWDTNMFSGLFQRVQEAAGVRRNNRPTPLARDLVRRLLMPQRKLRLSAYRALQHDWFKLLGPKLDPHASRVSSFTLTADEEDTPLLSWKDFEEGLASVEREIGRDLRRLASEASFVVVTAVDEVQSAAADWAAGVADAVGITRDTVRGSPLPQRAAEKAKAASELTPVHHGRGPEGSEDPRKALKFSESVTGRLASPGSFSSLFMGADSTPKRPTPRSAGPGHDRVVLADPRRQSATPRGGSRAGNPHGAACRGAALQQSCPPHVWRGRGDDASGSHSHPSSAGMSVRQPMLAQAGCGVWSPQQGPVGDAPVEPPCEHAALSDGRQSWAGPVSSPGPAYAAKPQGLRPQQQPRPHLMESVPTPGRSTRQRPPSQPRQERRQECPRALCLS